jgi:hypothetical protein
MYTRVVQINRFADHERNATVAKSSSTLIEVRLPQVTKTCLLRRRSVFAKFRVAYGARGKKSARGTLPAFALQRLLVRTASHWQNTVGVVYLMRGT